MNAISTLAPSAIRQPSPDLSVLLDAVRNSVPLQARDLPLSMMECANARLRPDVRIRCWPRFGLMRGNVSGRASNALLIAVDGRVQREAMLRQFENSFGGGHPLTM